MVKSMIKKDPRMLFRVFGVLWKSEEKKNRVILDGTESRDTFSCFAVAVDEKIVGAAGAQGCVAEEGGFPCYVGL